MTVEPLVDRLVILKEFVRFFVRRMIMREGWRRHDWTKHDIVRFEEFTPLLPEPVAKQKLQPASHNG